MDTSARHETVFLRGRRVYLRPPYKPLDLEFFQRWINDPDVRQNLKTRQPYTMVAEEKYFDRLGDNGDIVFTICLTNGTPIGTTGLHRINWIDRVATTGTWIAKPYWKQGYGTEAKLLLLYHAFETLNLRKICSSAFAGNAGSLKHNGNAGYRIEGRRRHQLYRRGRYHDEVLLACFREWWWPKWRTYQRRGKK